MAPLPAHHLAPLISAAQIQDRVREIGRRIETAYPADVPLRLAAILKGASFFVADLARAISRDVSIDFMVVTSYGSGADSTGEVRIIKDLQHSIAGIDVVVVEDIVDTGLTMSSLSKLLRSRGPHSLRTATLLDKPTRRIQPVDLDFVGFEIPDKFVVGYGLDYNEQYRNLPDIHSVEFDGM
jgi:hypoxanthine phosphoribosyltransferase